MRFVRFSLLLSALSLTSCSSGPKVTLCAFSMNDPGPHLICVDHDNKTFTLSVAEAESQGYIAMPDEDLRTLVEYCGLKGSEKKAVNARAAEIERILSHARDMGR